MGEQNGSSAMNAMAILENPALFDWEHESTNTIVDVMESIEKCMAQCDGGFGHPDVTTVISFFDAAAGTGNWRGRKVPGLDRYVAMDLPKETCVCEAMVKLAKSQGKQQALNDARLRWMAAFLDDGVIGGDWLLDVPSERSMHAVPARANQSGTQSLEMSDEQHPLIRPLRRREQERLAQARYLMVQYRYLDDFPSRPYFHGIPTMLSAFRALTVFVDERCPLAYTDCHFRIGINPNLLDACKTPLRTLAFLLTHMAMHTMLQHRHRFNTTDYPSAVRNVAADMEINWWLLQRMGMKPPVASQKANPDNKNSYADFWTLWYLLPTRGPNAMIRFPVPEKGLHDSPRFGNRPYLAEEYAEQIEREFTRNGQWNLLSSALFDDFNLERSNRRFQEADKLGFVRIEPELEQRIREQVVRESAEHARKIRNSGKPVQLHPYPDDDFFDPDCNPAFAYLAGFTQTKNAR